MTKLDKILSIPQWWMHVQQHNIKDIQMGGVACCRGGFRQILKSGTRGNVDVAGWR